MKKHKGQYKHGHCSNGKISSEYHSWSSMIRRCENPKSDKYEYYGGRGISVCKPWHKFKNFIEDMGKKPTPRHQIDRKDNNGNYNPENCRWVTRIQNARNKRSNNVIEYKGQRKCLQEWSDILQLNYEVLWARIHKDDWSVEKAFETSVLTYSECGRLSGISNGNKKGISGMTGVVWSEGSKRWIAKIESAGRYYYLGLFDDPLEAALIRDAAAIDLHGELAVLNK